MSDNMEYTIQDLADRINENGNVTNPDEKRMNLVFIQGLHAKLKEGGVWGFPAACEVYKKVGAGWERLL
jgi:hypothetical protein